MATGQAEKAAHEARDVFWKAATSAGVLGAHVDAYDSDGNSMEICHDSGGLIILLLNAITEVLAFESQLLSMLLLMLLKLLLMLLMLPHFWRIKSENPPVTPQIGGCACRQVNLRVVPPFVSPVLDGHNCNDPKNG